MSDAILLGRGQQMVELPRHIWEQRLAQVPQIQAARLAFMSAAHHRVRAWVVRELPRLGAPIAAAAIAQALDLPEAQVMAILDDLERHLFFLVRNEQGAVTWAFPVTRDPTPHRLEFSSGELCYAAWAEDALATPFVQGRLRNASLRVAIHTVCAHCGQPLQLSVDDTMRATVADSHANPLIFEPQVDWAGFRGANILDAYWRQSVFFWSEEHARVHREQGHPVDGVYLTLAQSAYSTPIVQGALFAFR